MQGADRRRLTVATLITVAALPALWLMQRDPSTPGTGAGVAAANASGGLALSGGASNDGDDATTSTSATTVAPAPDALQLMPQTTSAPAAGGTQPADTRSRRAHGSATYKRITNAGVKNACSAPGAPLNHTITVRSLNTGRTVRCANVIYTPLADGLVIVINTDTFLQIADTVDAPLPVEISW